MFTLTSTSMLLNLLLLPAFLHVVIAVPTSVQSQSVTTLSASQLDSYIPHLQFARAAYCPASVLQGWQCGEACTALSDFQPSLVGGDGNAIQTYFVGYWPSKNTIVIGHEGTDPTKILSVLTDGNVFLGNLDPNLFPGLPWGVQVHQGFRDEHAKTIAIISNEVKNLQASTGASSVTCIGHSLGGALAELDSLYFSLNLPNLNIITTTFGVPRVGNAAYASLFDEKVPNFHRVNNKLDPVPIVPGRGLGYQHPHGEIHILSPGHAVACSGDDDGTDSQCQNQSVPNIFEGNILDHLGPYEGVSLGTIFCT